MLSKTLCLVVAVLVAAVAVVSAEDDKADPCTEKSVSSVCETIDQYKDAYVLIFKDTADCKKLIEDITSGMKRSCTSFLADSKNEAIIKKFCEDQTALSKVNTDAMQGCVDQDKIKALGEKIAKKE